MKKNYYSFIALILLLLIGNVPNLHAQIMCPADTVIPTGAGQCTAVANFTLPSFGGPNDSAIFDFTSNTMWLVPSNIDTIKIECWGGQGNSNQGSFSGGLGGYAVGFLAVSSIDTLFVQAGDGGNQSLTGSAPGGGDAGTNSGCTSANGGGGGGASYVSGFSTGFSSSYIVAGGGGGAGGDRVGGCGRGTGGGGGGGWYGGGGGAAWPHTSLVVPTGGNQSTGGIGGTSAWTGTTGNSGNPGIALNGGVGGNEVGSNQSSSGVTSASAGSGGGTSGGIGAYIGNFTGQSGAGGSGYIGGVMSGSMQNGINSGGGMVRITWTYVTVTTQLSGIIQGDTVGTGVYQQVYVSDTGANADTCAFMVTIADGENPVAVCQDDTLSLDGSGQAMVSTAAIGGNSTDNCGIASMTASGSYDCNDADSSYVVWLMVMDSASNSDSCSAVISIVDDNPPVALCADLTVFLDSTGNYALQASSIDNGSSDNCSVSSVSVSPNAFISTDVGTNNVVLTVMDSSGNTDTCSSTVTVNAYVSIDGEMGLPGIELIAFPNPTQSGLSVKVTSLTGNLSETMHLKLVSIQGAMILEREVNLANGSLNLDLDLSKLANGYYNLILTGKEGLIHKGIIKQ